MAHCPGAPQSFAGLRGHHTVGTGAGGEPRSRIFAKIYLKRTPNSSESTSSFRKGADGQAEVAREPVPEIPPRLQQLIEEAD